MDQPTALSFTSSSLKPFGPVWDGAGTRGFFREGYWYHPLVPGLSFKGSAFVAKTVTSYPHDGNMALAADYTPLRRFPSCIVTYPGKKMALNAVGLSNPGINAILKTERWQRIRDPFFISYTPVLPKKDARHAGEVSRFIQSMLVRRCNFRTLNLGLQLNLSCPNAHQNMVELIERAHELLTALGELHLPIVVKLNLLVNPEVAEVIARHPACSGICIANSVPFGEYFPKAWWERFFRGGSPLEHRGFTAGGLSGAPLLREVAHWVGEFRRLDASTHVNAGGGILCEDDVDTLVSVGASSIFFSSVAMLRPWRVRSIIRRAHELLGNTT